MSGWKRSILSMMYENLSVLQEVEQNPLFRKWYRHTMRQIRCSLDWVGRP